MPVNLPHTSNALYRNTLGRDNNFRIHRYGSANWLGNPRPNTAQGIGLTITANSKGFSPSYITDPWIIYTASSICGLEGRRVHRIHDGPLTFLETFARNKTSHDPLSIIQHVSDLRVQNSVTPNVLHCAIICIICRYAECMR